MDPLLVITSYPDLGEMGCGITAGQMEGCLAVYAVGESIGLRTRPVHHSGGVGCWPRVRRRRIKVAGASARSKLRRAAARAALDDEIAMEFAAQFDPCSDADDQHRCFNQDDERREKYGVGRKSS